MHEYATNSASELSKVIDLSINRTVEKEGGVKNLNTLKVSKKIIREKSRGKPVASCPMYQKKVKIFHVLRQK